MIKSIKRYSLILFALAAIQLGTFSSVRAVGPCETMFYNCLFTAEEAYIEGAYSFELYVAFVNYGNGYCINTYDACENPPN